MASLASSLVASGVAAIGVLAMLAMAVLGSVHGVVPHDKVT